MILFQSQMSSTHKFHAATCYLCRQNCHLPNPHVCRKAGMDSAVHRYQPWEEPDSQGLQPLWQLLAWWSLKWKTRLTVVLRLRFLAVQIRWIQSKGRYYSLAFPLASAAVEISHHPSPTAATLFHPDFELVPAVPSVPSAPRSPEPADHARFLKLAGPAPGLVKCGLGALYQRTWLKARKGVWTVMRSVLTTPLQGPNTSWVPFSQHFSPHKGSLLILLPKAQTQASLIDKPFDGGVSTERLPWQLLYIKSCLHTLLPSLTSHLQMNP